MEKIMLGMSGGVDSAATAAILKDSGYTVIGATLRLFDTELLADDELPKSISDAKSVCDVLGIEHRIIDLREQFLKEIVEYFISEYISGRTPNPCIVCNRRIKFGAMLDVALQSGCQKIATGHYAGLVYQNGRYLLTKAADISKDQSYVLYTLNQHQLSHLLFPLGKLTKPEARAIAEENGFINAHKGDSQDICFIPDGDYASFIARYSEFGLKEGDFVDEKGKKIGKHSGIVRYTIGQRKGLGIAMGRPIFVLEKDAEANRVVIGDEKGLFYRCIEVENMNYIAFEKLTGDIKAKAKLRYRHIEQSAIIHSFGENRAIIEFEKPQRAPSPGQAVVIYDGDIVLGGGTIVKGIK